MEAGEVRPEHAARALLRGAARATLATALSEKAWPEGAEWPYASLVLVACDHDATPVLMISALAEHTRNIAKDPRVSLLIEATQGYDDPLEGPRLTVLGRAETTDLARHRTRFLARHPAAARYADFGDFACYKVAIERAHLVAGFGRIDWIDGSVLLFDATGAASLAEVEPSILEHMNRDHAEAISLYASALLGLEAGAWVRTGIDPEGCDLRRGARVARVAFDAPISESGEARSALVDLARRAGAIRPGA